jgi:hypothetical protein
MKERFEVRLPLYTPEILIAFDVGITAGGKARVPLRTIKEPTKERSSHT